MKSDVCSILNDKESLSLILDEVEKCAEYNHLEERAARQLRLLAEELVAMLPELVIFKTGEFWVENSGDRYEIHATINAAKDDLMYREKVMTISKSGINEASKGILGKIRETIEIMAEGYNFAGELGVLPTDERGYYSSSLYAQAWSLSNYINQSEDENKEAAWDELEKSIIAKVADDVVVGVQKGIVHIVLKKRF